MAWPSRSPARWGLETSPAALGSLERSRWRGPAPKRLRGSRNGGLLHPRAQTHARMLEPWFRRALERKRDGGALDGPTWDRIVTRYVAGTVDEAAIAALLMAIAIRGLDADETFALTDAMIRSGDVLSFGDVVVDKHSSGGVADTVSLLVV